MTRIALLLILAACGGAARKSGGGGLPPAPTPPGDGFVDPRGDKLDVRQHADFDGLHVVGAIPKDSIHRVVRENFASIRQCYEQVVMANPGLAGRVIAKFKVGFDGTVQDASATGVHPDLETCVATQVRKFKFPRPDKGDVVVEYPFVFKPG